MAWLSWVGVKGPYEINGVDICAMLDQELDAVQVAVVCAADQRTFPHLHISQSALYNPYRGVVAKQAAKSCGRVFRWRTTFRWLMFAPSESSSLTHARCPTQDANLSTVRLWQVKKECLSWLSPLPAARSRGGSPQWSASFRGAPYTKQRTVFAPVTRVPSSG